jgi:hypothetical protein
MVASECGAKAIVSPCLQQFLHGPDVIGKPGLHSRRDTDSLMNTNEIEKGHVQIHGGFQMIETLAESEAQARKTTQVRPNTQVGAFDVRGADSCFVRVSADYDGNGRRDFRWFVPVRRVSALCPVQLDQLSEVNIGSKVFFDGGNVTAQTVRRELESSTDTLAQITDEVVSARSFTFGNEIGQNYFRIAINRHPNVGVAPLHRSARTQMTFFGVNESPEFVGLHKARMNAANAGIEKSTALIASGQKNRKNRALVDSSNTRDGANAHTFQQERYDLCDSGRFRVVGSDAFARLRECRPATETAIALDSALSAKPEAFRSGVLALEARHGLLFLREKPYNQSSGSECGLRPRLDSASPLVQASGEASVYSLLLKSRKLFNKFQVFLGFGLFEGFGHSRHSLPSLLPIFNGLMSSPAFREAIKDRVNCCQGIALLRKAVPEFIQSSPDLNSGQWDSSRPENSLNIFGNARIYQFAKNGSRFIHEVIVAALANQDCKRVHCLSQCQDSLLNALLFLQERFQFTGGCFIGSVEWLVLHDPNLSEV